MYDINMNNNDTTHTNRIDIECTNALRDKLIAALNLPSNEQMAESFGPGKAAVHPSIVADVPTHPKPITDTVYTAEVMYHDENVGLVSFMLNREGDVINIEADVDRTDDYVHFEDGWSYDDLDDDNDDDN